MRTLITKPQLKKLHTLLSKAGMLEQKADMVNQYSNGRTTSSRELFTDEASELIKSLAKDDPFQKMRSKVLAICFSIGWFSDGPATEWQINYATLDLWLQKYGVVKKPFRTLNVNELRLVLSQLERMTANMKASKEAQQIEDSLRKELDALGIASEGLARNNSTGSNEK